MRPRWGNIISFLLIVAGLFVLFGPPNGADQLQEQLARVPEGSADPLVELALLVGAGLGGIALGVSIRRLCDGWER